MRISGIQMPRLFLDCDGVKADFHRKASQIFGMDPDEFEAKYGSKAFWQTLRDYREGDLGFFETLPLMPDAMVLFRAVEHLKPTILTGCPHGDWAPEQKMRWGARKFPGVRMITCSAKEKIQHLENPGDVLVDDMTKYQHIWEEGGGIFVHHTDAKSTIEKLKDIYPIWFQITDQWTPRKG